MEAAASRRLVELLAGLYSDKAAFYQSDTVMWRSRVERRIMDTSSSIRGTSQWQHEWQQDSLRFRQRVSETAERLALTADDIRYVLDELKYYSSVAEKAGRGVSLLPVDMVWQLQPLAENNKLAVDLCNYSVSLEQDLRRSGNKLGQDHMCIDTLVDPSLYPLMPDMTLVVQTPIASPRAAVPLAISGQPPMSHAAWTEILDRVASKGDSAQILGPKYRGSRGSSLSEQGCWLPTEFDIDKHGVARILSYVNNLHPIWHAGMYPAIQDAMTCLVPLLENVLTDLAHPRGPRVPVDIEKCVTFSSPHPETAQYTIWESFGSVVESAVSWDEWAEGIQYHEPRPARFRMPLRPSTRYLLCDVRLQASVELISIRVPDTKSPACLDNSWRMAGGQSERIVATGMYFFGAENVSNFEIQLQEIVPHSVECSGNRRQALKMVYGDDGTETRRDRYKYPDVSATLRLANNAYLSFPSTYKFRISSLERRDKSLPGTARVLVFYVVDPARRGLSTEMVPPQQQSWWAEVVFKIPPLCALPYEICQHILEFVDHPMGLRQADRRRATLEASHAPAPSVMASNWSRIHY